MTVHFYEVKDVLENYKTAIAERNVEKLLSIYADDIHIYDCWGSWELVGISHWREAVIDWFNDLKKEGNILQIVFNDLVVEENVNIAFVHCCVTFAAYKEDSQEKLRQMTNRFTFGLRKENESWNIIHEHSSLPINMETGKGIFNLK